MNPNFLIWMFGEGIVGTIIGIKDNLQGLEIFVCFMIGCIVGVGCAYVMGKKLK